jgi:aminoglycoside phosphotransferase (APT) family kinase protein
VKLLEPESVEGDKLPAERAILGIVEGRLPVPKLLGYGTTEAKPVRTYNIYEWVEGDLWKEVVHKLGREERLQLLRDAGEYLGRLHSLPVPDPGATPEIPRGNYQRWRTRNLPILDDNLRFLVNVSELTRTQADRVLDIVAAARPRLFKSPTALVHGDFSGQNILVDRNASPPKISAIIDWGNVGVGPLEADYEMVLLDVLFPEPDGDGGVTPHPAEQFREMCQAIETGYREERGLGIDWGVMRAHALLQWVKRCVNNRERKPRVSRSLAASIRMAVSLQL